jgi:hypothetical protein
LEINYIILAHKNPEQLKRLILKLTTTCTYFYIHIDRGVDLEPFQKELYGAKNIYFLTSTEREKGNWGDIGIVKATINALKKVVAHKRNGYCILLSGQDYPLQTNEHIQRFFSKNREHHFITAYSLPHSQLDRGGLSRINRYKINKSQKRGHFLLLNSIFQSEFYSLETLGQLNFLRKSAKWKDFLQIFKKRKFPEYLKPYAGSQWWALSIPSIKKILSFIDAHPEYSKYHHYSLLPDEMFFQSIIIHIEKTEKLGISKSLTYVNWERPTGPLPVTFKTEDYKELKEASKDYLFARKFDIKQDSEILDEIDKNLLS